MKYLVLLLTLALSSLHAADLPRSITADGTYTHPTYIGKRYVVSVSGTFGGGSLAINWTDGITSTAYTGSPATAAKTFTFTAAAATAEFILTGSTTPALAVSLALADSGSSGGTVDVGDITGLGTAATADSTAFQATMKGVVVTKKDGTRTAYAPSADTDTARFVAWTAAHTALLAGETIETPPGDYYITTNFINLKSATYIFNGSRFYINASTAAGGGGAYANWTFYAVDLTHFSIRGQWIIDGGSVSGKVGLVTQRCLGVSISDIWIKNFTGGGGTTGVGFLVGGDSVKVPGKSATNLRITGCGTGIRTEGGAEYWTFTNVHIDSCTAWGVISVGGNNQWVGCMLTLNAIGFDLWPDSNAGHGSFIGGAINHNTSKGIQVKTLFTKGFEFVGTQIFANGTGGIDLGGKGVHFTGCEIDGNITCSQAQEGLHVFRGCMMPDVNVSIDTLTAPQRANIKFYGCKTTTADWAYNDPEAPPHYTVATLPAAAAATYGTCAVSDATTPSVGSTVTGGGSVKALVTSNGATWTVTAIP